MKFIPPITKAKTPSNLEFGHCDLILAFIAILPVACASLKNLGNSKALI